MEDKLEQLENLLNQIFAQVESHLLWQGKSIKEIQDSVFEIFEIRDPPELNDRQIEIINRLIFKANDKDLTSKEIPRLKTLLLESLEKINQVDAGRFGETKFGSKRKGPNSDFKALLSQKILTTNSLIYAKHNSTKYEGQLSPSGYFNLSIEAGVKQFSSLSTAASFVCNKPIQKGWDFWFAIDREGNERNM